VRVLLSLSLAEYEMFPVEFERYGTRTTYTIPLNHYSVLVSHSSFHYPPATHQSDPSPRTQVRECRAAR